MPVRLLGLALVALITQSRGEAQSVPQPAVRTIWASAQDGAMVSPDGKLVAFVDWNVSQVAVRDAATATERKLPDTGSRGFPEPYFVFSPNSNRLLFPFGNTRDAAPFRYELRMIDLTSGSHEVLAAFSTEVAFLAPLAWHSDAGIMFSKVAGDGSSELLVLNPVNKNVRVLQRRRADAGQVWQALFTRDGRSLVVLANDSLSWVDVARGASRPLGVHAQILLGWAAGENALLFHDARGTMVGNWSVPFSNGRVVGAPTLVQRTANGVRWAGQSPEGVHYLEPVEAPRLYQTTVDVSAAGAAATPGPILGTTDSIAGNPVWSRDGSRLAFTLAPANRNTNRILAAEGGRGVPREIARVEMRVAGLDWSADGRFLVVGGKAATRDAASLQRINVATGAIETLATGANASALAAGVGDQVVFTRGAVAGSRNVHVMHLHGAGATPQVLATYTTDDMPRSLSVSPDGQWVAMLKSVPGRNASALLLLPISGGEPRTVLQVQRPDGLELNQGHIPWTPDGKNVLVMLRRQGRRQLVAVRLDSGELTALSFAPQQGGRHHFALHPDGRALVYVDGGGRDELKVMIETRR